MKYLDQKTALRLKALNFHERVLTYFENDEVKIYHNPKGWDFNNSFSTCLSRPTIVDALDWLEDQYDFAYEIVLDRTTQPKYACELYKYEYFGNYTRIIDKGFYLYRNQKEVRQEYLEFILGLIESEEISLKKKVC